MNLSTHNLYLRYFCFRLDGSEGGLFPLSLEGGVFDGSRVSFTFFYADFERKCVGVVDLQAVNP